MEVLYLILLVFFVVLLVFEIRFIVAVPTHLDDIADELKAIKNVLRERL